MSEHSPAYHLVRPPARAAGAPVLDAAQQAVVDHAGLPLLVLAGPGTGKTTAIVETVVDRITGRGTDPDRVLVLTFSRKAAEELRQRITARLGRTTREPLALTFHSYAYALVRREFMLAGDEPPTLLSGPEQLLEVRRLLRGEAEDGGTRWPERLRPALGTRGFAAELRDFLLRGAERGFDGRALARLGRQRDRDDWVAAGALPGPLRRHGSTWRRCPPTTTPRSSGSPRRCWPAVRSRERERKAYDVVLVDEYQDTDPAQEALLHALAGDGRELIVVGDPDQSIYAFRGADTSAIMRFPDRFRTPDDRPARVVALAYAAAAVRPARGVAPDRGQAPGPARRGPAARRAASPHDGQPATAASPVTASPAVAPAATAARASPAVASPGPARPGPPSRQGHRDLRPLASAPAGTHPVVCRERQSGGGAGGRPAPPGPPGGRRALVLDGGAGALGHPPGAGAARALAAAGVPVAVAGDELPLAAEPGARPLILLLRCALHPGELTRRPRSNCSTGPLGGTDALGLRRLRRALRAAAEDAGEGSPPQPLAAVLRDPRELALIRPRRGSRPSGWPGCWRSPGRQPRGQRGRRAVGGVARVRRGRARGRRPARRAAPRARGRP